MKKYSMMVAIVVVSCLVVIIPVDAQKSGGAKSGEAMFKEHCAVCHPDGGNIVTPGKTLHKKDFNANNIKKPEDIVKTMRKPGPGMTAFDQKTITDKDAKAIAEYVLKTFK